MQKAYKKEFSVEKVIKRKCDKKIMIILSTIGLIKKTYDKQMSKYFPKRRPWRGNVKTEVDLSNYTTKSD